MTSREKNFSNLQELIQLNPQTDKESGLLLRSILSAGRKKGVHRHELWKTILEYFNVKENQKKWSDWKSLDDREEIRLRLKVLQHVSVLDGSLTGFIRFFFRASDPVLYQLAAKVLGREMKNFPELKEYLAEYCKKRNIPADQSIRLNNQRSRRRVLLVRSAAYSDDNNISEASFPLPFQDVSELSDSDISILFAACSLLLQAGRKECREYAEKILNERFDSKREIRDRNLVRNAGILIGQLKRSELPAGDLFGVCFKGVLNQYHRSENFASRLQSLLLMDELMESSILLGLSFTGAKRDWHGSERFNKFLKGRTLFWSFQNRSAVEYEGYDTEMKDSSVVDYVYKTLPHERYEDHYRLFAEGVNLISNEQKWRTLTLDERAYQAFYLIDFCIHTEIIDEEELILLFRSSSLIEREDTSAKLGETPLSPLVRKLLELEPSFSRQLFDPQLIHRLDDPLLLPALIPSDADSEFLPMLADAVEHQIRFRLIIDPEFNPDHYLYLLSVRRPNQKFFRFLAELSHGREYRRGVDGFYPLSDISQMLAERASSGNSRMEKRDNGTPFFEVLDGLRSELLDLKGEQDPQKILRGVVHHLRGTGAETARQGITLHDLIEIAQPSGSVWFRAGNPPYTSKKSREIADRILLLSDNLEEKANRMVPENLLHEFRVSETIQGIEHYLGLLKDEFVPLAGFVESAIFSDLISESIQRLQQWDMAYGSSAQIWKNKKGLAKEELWENLYSLVLGQENEAVQYKLLSIVTDSTLEECGRDSDSSWLKRYEFLNWATGSVSSNFKNSALEAVWSLSQENLWRELVEEAMDRNAEARVVQLIRMEAFSEIRNRPLVKEMLGRVKQWCFNRHDIFHAYQCNRAINEKKNPILNIVKTISQYTGNFARVWLALLVGVIFMFDFGDPWFELAEIGDVGGVAFAFLFGVAGTFLYVWSDLRKKIVYLKGDPFQWVSIIGRVSIFILITFIYTALVVSLFWYMFSSTDQVVHGPNAPLHLISWTGFALFVGVFLGLLGQGD